MPSAGRGGPWLAGLLLVGAVFATFSPALTADFQVAFDDNYNLTENGFYRGLSPSHLAWMLTTFRLGHWQPLSWLSLAVDHALWGMDARGYHLTNLVLHALNAVLFFFLAGALFRAAGARAAGRSTPALASALCFAVHPLRVESVVWITERRDVLSVACLQATLLAWLAWCERGGARRYALALVFYLLSLGSKAWGITLPALFLLLDAWPLARLSRASFGARVVEKLPFLALALGAAVLAFFAQKTTGAMHYAEHFTLLQKLAQACYGLSFYVQKSLWPAGLLPAYMLDRDLDPAEARFLAGFAVSAAGLTLAWLLRRRWPAFGVALLAYAILVSPVLGLTQSGIQLVADRYTYLATMPLALLLGAGLAALASAGARRAAYALCFGACLPLAWHAHAYSKVWRDSWSLWTYTVARDPEHSFAYNQLGNLYKDAGDDARATELFETAVRTDPTSHLAYENRGIMRLRAGDSKAALADWERAIELNDRCPIPIVNRGSLRFEAKDYAGARADYLHAIELKEDQAGVWYMLGSASFKLGDRAGARAAVARCLELSSPGTPIHEQALRFQADLGS
jgi:tetratricopeptide (TPR) repeat protein